MSLSCLVWRPKQRTRLSTLLLLFFVVHSVPHALLHHHYCCRCYALLSCFVNDPALLSLCHIDNNCSSPKIALQSCAGSLLKHCQLCTSRTRSSTLTGTLTTSVYTATWLSGCLLQVTIERVRIALKTKSILIYLGHAVFDNKEPLKSHLCLADGNLTGQDILSMSSSMHLQLVGQQSWCCKSLACMDLHKLHCRLVVEIIDVFVLRLGGAH